jgi:4-hydroxymandelate oxidase
LKPNGLENEPMPRVVNLFEYERLAQAHLTPMAYDYYASGAMDEITVQANRRAYDDIYLRYRVLAGVGTRDTSTTVLGQRVALPVLVAPSAFHGLAHPEGERATARGAAAAGTVYVMSSLSNTLLEDVAKVSTGLRWFQLYVYKDRGVTRSLVERAEAAGYTALELTTDAPVWGQREADIRNHFHLPGGLTVKNLAGADAAALPEVGQESGLTAYVARLLDDNLTWRDVEWLRSITRLPVLVKGIARGDDAQRALDCGAAGVVVSNHGGRQLDTARPTIRALPEVVQAVAGRAEVLVDGGIRRGTDVLKALALGARAVQVGRPILWGLAVEGEAGVHNVLDILRREFDQAMALCGCRNREEITPDLIA